MNKKEIIDIALKTGKRLTAFTLIYVVVDSVLTNVMLNSKESLSKASAIALTEGIKEGEITEIFFTGKPILGLLGKTKLKFVAQYRVLDIKDEYLYTVEYVGKRPATKKEKLRIKDILWKS